MGDTPDAEFAKSSIKHSFLIWFTQIVKSVTFVDAKLSGSSGGNEAHYATEQLIRPA